MFFKLALKHFFKIEKIVFWHPIDASDLSVRFRTYNSIKSNYLMRIKNFKILLNRDTFYRKKDLVLALLFI